jgi:hypothetical protein
LTGIRGRIGRPRGRSRNYIDTALGLLGWVSINKQGNRHAVLGGAAQVARYTPGGALRAKAVYLSGERRVGGREL